MASDGTQETFELSEPTRHIDEFLSHSWSSNGRLKWLSVCLDHNGPAAVKASVLAGALVALLETTQLVTTGLPIAQHTWFDGRVRGISFAPYLASYSAFLLVLLFGSLLPGAVAAGRNPVMFLDKICIHQQDPSLKQQGIRGINEFIRRSSRMLVCHSAAAPGGSYFERLWCVFELASFVSKCREADRRAASEGKAGSSRAEHVDERLVVLPLWRPVCLLAVQLGLVVGHASEYISSLPAGGASMGDSCDSKAYGVDGSASSAGVHLGIVGFVQGFMLRMSIGMLIPFWIDLAQMAEKELLLAQVRSFRFENVQCRDPDDRERVYQAIAELYERDGDEVGGDPDSSPSRRRGIERFERDVQSGGVYTVVERAIGTQTGALDRRHAVVAFLPNLYRAFSYFPQNFHSQPNLFLFHAVVLMVLSPRCREWVLSFYRAYLQAWLPRRASCTLGCLVVSVLFSFLVLATAFPCMLALRLVALSDLWILVRVE